MENTKYDEPQQKDTTYFKYICVVFQYVSKINSEKIMKFLKSYQNENTQFENIGKHHFHYRLANEEAALQISGKGHNAVVPFLF